MALLLALDSPEVLGNIKSVFFCDLSNSTFSLSIADCLAAMLKTGSRFKFLCDTKELPSSAVANEVAEAVDSSLSTATYERSQCHDLGWQGDDDVVVVWFTVNYYWHIIIIATTQLLFIIMSRPLSILLLNNNTKRMDGNKPLRLEMGEIEQNRVCVPNFFSFYLLNYFIIAYPWWRTYPEYI